MLFRQLVELVGHEPVFETVKLLVGDLDPADVRRQLSRWTAAGRLIQLRRGLYMIAPPFQKAKPHPFLVANRLVPGSYVSGASALGYYSMYLESQGATTSITTARPGRWSTPIGEFDYRHVKPELLTGYRRLALGSGQAALIATPEKALLDLAYLRPGGDSRAYLHGLRLQNLERLDVTALREFARRAESPKLARAANLLIELVRDEMMEYQQL